MSKWSVDPAPELYARALVTHSAHGDLVRTVVVSAHRRVIRRVRIVARRRRIGACGMDAPRLWAAMPEEDGAGRGRRDLAALEHELGVKVCFCEDGHVLLVGARARLQKKCFVLRNLLSHYHWRQSGKDVAFEAMVAR